jgi:hypothetical protein
MYIYLLTKELYSRNIEFAECDSVPRPGNLQGFPFTSI